MADDEPLLTRWTFEDFKLYYDVRFGRKKEPVEECNLNSESHHNGSNQSTSSQERKMEQYHGVIPNGANETLQKSLLPPFESAEMRTLAEALCRDIIRGSPDVKWESIKGLDAAK